MRKINSLLIMISATMVLVAVNGCKSSQEYAEERGRKAVTQYQMAKYREIQNGKPLSLAQCIEIALQNNLDVRVYELEQEVAKEFRTAEALGMLPDLTLTNNFTARSNTPASSSKKLVSSGETYGASVAEDRNVNYLNIDLVLSMLDFGLAYFNTQQAQDRVYIRKQRTERAVQNLSFDVVRAYFKVAAAQRAHGALNLAFILQPITRLHAKVREYAGRIAMKAKARGHRALHIAIELNEVVARNGLRKRHTIHPAPDVDAHQIRNDLVAQVCRKANHAALALMGIGHDADLGAFKRRTAGNLLDLLLG